MKDFLKTSLENLEVNTIITDGYLAYDSIIDELGFNHQRCTFHSMKNLMDKIICKHNRFNREIKSLNNEIKELEEKISEISKKYKGQTGRIQTKETQRQKDNTKKKNLKKKLNEEKRIKKEIHKQIKCR